MTPQERADFERLRLLLREVEAWKSLALQAIGAMEGLSSLPSDLGVTEQNIEGHHDDQMMAIEKELLLKALLKNGGNRHQTAKFLGLNRTTLHDRLKKLGIHELLQTV